MREAAVCAVHLDGSDVRAEADHCVVLTVLGYIDPEPFVQVVFIGRPHRHRHVQISAADPFQTGFPVDQDVVVIDADSPVVLQFADRILVQTAVLHGEFSRDGHLSHKAEIRESTGRCLPVLHPGNHDSASVLGEKCLRRIEIEAVVDRLHGFAVQMLRCPVKSADQADVRVPGVEFQADCGHFLRADQQDVFSVQGEEIRALPHFAKLVVTGREYADEVPVDGVLTLIQENGSAAVCTPVSDHRVIQSVFAPDLRIAEVVCAAAVRKLVGGDDRVGFVFFIIHAVSDRDALRLKALDPAAFASYISYTRVHEQLAPVRHFNSTAGEAPAAVIFLIRRKRRREAFPLDEVRRFDVAPVHRAPFDIIGIILEKKMIFALVDGKTVRVIDPADSACRVESGLVRSGERKVFLFKFAGLCEKFTRHGSLLLICR